MKCAFCVFGVEPFPDTAAEFVIDGISVCTDHVDTVSGRGFGRDLAQLRLEMRTS